MRARLINLLAQLRSSMWFLPSLMALLALAAALALSLVDARVPASPRAERLLFSGGPSGARAILSTIAGSMVGVTGVVFSITIVALTLASGQFGPRLLRNFMRDRAVQAVLGTFIATFAFCLMGLRAIRETDEGGGYVIVLVAVALALVSIGVLIFFIHHIATAIQADTVIANVADELSRKIVEMYPEALGEPAALAARHLPVGFETGARIVGAPRSGYIQSIDADALMELAGERDVVVRLDSRPGDFVVAGRPLLRVFPAERVDEATARKLSGVALVGKRRTAQEDVEFLIEQLVEIASRALSPGVNDPFTAIACIDRLGATLSELSTRRMPSAWREDAKGSLRVVVDQPTFEGIADAAFHQVRQHGAMPAAVTIRLLETLEMLCEVNARDAGRRTVFRDHADRVLRSSQLHDHEREDAQAILESHARVVAAAM